MNDTTDFLPPYPDEPPPDDIPTVLPVAEPRQELPPDVLPVIPRPGLGMAVVWLVVFMVAQVFMGIAIHIIQDAVGQRLSIAGWIVLAVTCNLLISLVIVGSQLGNESRSALALRGFRPLHLGIVLALVVPLAATTLMTAGAVGIALKLLLEAWLPPESAKKAMEFMMPDEKMVVGAVRESLWLTIAFVGPLTGLAEETLFRGFLSRGLVARYGLVLGTCITSALFAAAHLHPIQICGVFVLGVAFQLILWSARSLWLPILAHALHNSLVMSLALLPQAQAESLFSPVLILLSPPAMLALLWLLYITRTEWRMPNGLWSPGYPTAEIPPKEVPAMLWHRPAPGAAVAFAALLCLALYGDLAFRLFAQFGK